jgi:hypothetical protein
MVKIAERRATLLGLNPPIGHAVAVIQHEPPAKKTTTQEIGDLICGCPPPSRVRPD